MKYLFLAIFICIAALSAVSEPKENKGAMSISLAGDWDLCLDSTNFENIDKLDFDLSVKLPGTLDEASIGKRNKMVPEMKRETMLHLQRKYEYIGKAWYRKTIEIPENVVGKYAVLKLERVLWKSTVYVDKKLIGSMNSLSVPHVYDLKDILSPGKHQILICIDNSRQFNLNKSDMATAYTNETQIMWNGIIGTFTIDFNPFNCLKKIDVYANGDDFSLTAKVEGNLLPTDKLEMKILSYPDLKEISTELFNVNSKNFYSAKIPQHLKLWDEFSPSLYKLELNLIRHKKTIQQINTSFGFRSLKSNGTQLELNGKPLFLRGTLDCCIFPQTGHPEMKKEGWTKIFKTIKSYGLNHVRFHSWCPPLAAFEAADLLGIYLQVELPNWSLNFGQDLPTASFIENEASNIIREYGNHPSFCFLSMGNELEGDFNRLRSLVNTMKHMDQRHLYTTTTFSFQTGHGKSPEPVDDYFITQYTDNGWVRGQGIFDAQYPKFNTDYTDAVSHLKVPLITHEIGQYSVYPNLKEIGKYNGVLDPLNFKAIKIDLEKKGLLHLAGDYLNASGRLAVLLYKEEIERALKTNGVSGFQLLGLQDFSGQGTALVGLLDAFWDSKGIIDSSEFKQFCSETVPLIWLDKAVFRNSEKLSFSAGIANYGAELRNKTLVFNLIDNQGKILDRIETKIDKIPSGKVTRDFNYEYSLSQISSACRLTIELMVEGTDIRNKWSVWVYPELNKEKLNSDIFITQSFDEAEKALNEGKKVFLNPDIKDLKGLEGKFVQVFWSPVHFPDQPGTMGLLIDPKHPAYNYFPTDFYSNWQWWNLCKQSKTLDFGDLSLQPLVRVIDNFFKNRNLTNMFEANVLKGKLVFTSIDLTNHLELRPEACQLKYSIMKYMESDKFYPVNKIEFESVKKQFSQK